MDIMHACVYESVHVCVIALYLRGKEGESIVVSTFLAQMKALCSGFFQHSERESERGDNNRQGLQEDKGRARWTEKDVGYISIRVWTPRRLRQQLKTRLQ